MKALVLNALGRGFDFEDVDIAALIFLVVGSTSKMWTSLPPWGVKFS